MYFDSHVHIGCPKAKPTAEQKEWLGYSGYVKTTPEKFIKTALTHSVVSPTFHVRTRFQLSPKE